MQLQFDSSGSVEGFAASLQALASRADVAAIVVLACDENGWQPEDVDPLLQTAEVPVSGGIFPQIAYQGGHHAKGTLLLGLAVAPEFGVIEGLSDARAEYEEALLPLAEQWPEACGEQTYLVIVDGLASRISALIESLFYTFGLENNFIGGGAGSLSFEKRACVITPQGLKKDAALIALLPVPSSIGVTHGWEPVSEAFTVTSSERNVVKSIDWEPAGTFYARMIHAHSGQDISVDNFFSVAKSYPLGISRLGAEMVVRDPLMMNEQGELTCVGEVPEGCMVKLLNGNPDTLIAAAADAREQAMANHQGSSRVPTDWLLIDCISRVLFLGDDMTRELQAVGQGEAVFGAFTLGEIANSGSDYLAFYNKTIVLSVLG